MKLRIMAALMGMAVSPLQAVAFDDEVFATGQRLLSWCDRDQDMASAYIMAFIDTSEHVKERTVEASKRSPRNSAEYEEFLHRFVGNFCLPKSLTTPIATQSACEWLREHPDRLSMSAAILLQGAYHGAFPCLDE